MRTSRWTAVLAGMVLVGIATRVLAAGPPIEAYTIFGENGVIIGFDSDIVGLVGARNEHPVTGDAVRLQGRATIDGDVRSGGDVNLQNNAAVFGTVYRAPGTTLSLGSNSTVGGDVVGDPMLPDLPAPTPFTCPTGGQNFSGGNNQSLSLGPGTYGALSFGGRFNLTLDGAGDYFFQSINAGNGSTLRVTQFGTRVFVCGAARWGSVNVTVANGGACGFRLETHATGANAFQAGGNSNWIGNVFAPNGEIHIGSGGSRGTFVGQLFANGIDIEHSIAGIADNCVNPPPPPPPGEVGKDATILHFQKNRNNGANLTLRVERQIRSLVGFDVRNVDFANVTSAQLVLTISNNGFDVPPFSPPSGWPAGGGPVYAARLNDGFEDWAEGNGNNYPVPNNPKGTGWGVTWNCSTDTNIANQKPDCFGVARWKTGGKKVQGPARGPAVVTNDLPDGTQIVIDVTEDVKAGLGPNDEQFMTWFIYKPGPGSVAFYSREGAEAAGNPALAPALVIQ
ncbi:MAG TPA: hypothetical protein VIS07_09495 [Candidatus Binatia bacterium]